MTAQTVESDGDDVEGPLRRAVKKIGNEPEIPSFEKLLRSIVSALSDPRARLSDITSLVVRDYCLCLKITRTANSAMYNRSGERIESVERAMMLLGSRVVREIAGAMIYFGTFNRRSPLLSELLMLSLLIAHLARRTGERLKLGGTEGLFLAGMFHNLGQVLTAAYYPLEFVRIRSGAARPEEPDPATVHEVLGFTYNELGKQVGDRWGLPKQVLQSMSPELEPSSRIEHRVIRFAHEVGVASFAGSEKNRGALLNDLYGRHLPELQLRSADVQVLLQRTVADTAAVFVDAGMTLDAIRLLNDASAAAAVSAQVEASSAEPERDVTAS